MKLFTRKAFFNFFFLTFEKTWPAPLLRQTELNETDLWGWRTELVLSILIAVNSDLRIQDAIGIGSRAFLLGYDSPIFKGPSIRFDTMTTHGIRRSTCSRWSRTPGRFVATLSVCCCSRSMQHDCHAHRARAEMFLSGAVFLSWSTVRVN